MRVSFAATLIVTCLVFGFASPGHGEESTWPPESVKQSYQLMGEMAFVFGHCAKYMSPESQKIVAKMISADDVKWPPHTEEFKAEMVKNLQSFYVKGLADDALPDVGADSCQKILDDIASELNAIYIKP